MKGRVEWDGKYSSIAIDWHKFVDEPAGKGYYVEAFASADAIIDGELFSLLRQIYGSFESQNLINHLISVRDDTKFFGSGILGILEKIFVVKGDLAGKIREFKGKRNKVCHNYKAEYALVNPVKPTHFKTQEEYDDAVSLETKRSLVKAEEIFVELVELNKKVCDKLKDMDDSQRSSWLIQKDKEL